jgi:hypothetical protein
MSFTQGTQAEIVFANGFAYPTANAASTSAQSLVTGASGKFQQPYFQGGFFQQGRTGQVAKAEFTITIGGQASATTAIITAGLNTAPNNVAGSTLVAANAVTVTNFASSIFHGELLISCFGAGYGTSSVSTNLSSTIDIRFNNGSTTQPAASSGQTLGGPTALQTIDFSVNQWLYLTVTFSTSSASNTATLGQLIVYGLNLRVNYWLVQRDLVIMNSCRIHVRKMLVTGQ